MSASAIRDALFYSGEPIYIESCPTKRGRYPSAYEDRAEERNEVIRIVTRNER